MKCGIPNTLPDHYWKEFFIEGYFIAYLFEVQSTDQPDVLIETGERRDINVSVNLN